MKNSMLCLRKSLFYTRCWGFWLLINLPLQAQDTFTLSGRIVIDEKVESGIVALKGTSLQTSTDAAGNFRLSAVPAGTYTMIAFCMGKKTEERQIEVQADIRLDFYLQDFSSELEAVTIQAERERTFGLTRLQAVENFGIYEGRKSEVIVLKDITANLATNNARQVYARITGLNIWESDQAGLQLGIGGRGLNPNRTSNFNVRQNGYDISADALGYPESYYTPPVEALERIEIVRGAASLQYGTQFGGMLNFKFKKGPEDKKIELTSRQSVGSWGFFNTFNSIGGKVGKLNYYTYYQYKRGDGYRANSGFDYHNFYTSLDYELSSKFSANVEFTKMYYLAQQPGGLTDRNFQDNPRQSLRARNWFQVDWNLLALNFTYKISENTQLNFRNFGLMAKRQAVGNLERITRADEEERTLIDGRFNNIGHESRLLQYYTIGKQKHTFLAGARLYRGTTTARQGFGTTGSDANFSYLNPNDLENSDYRFPNQNQAVFVENIFNISEKFSLTPGIRWERINTLAEGYYKSYVRDGAGNVIVEERIDERQGGKRNFVLFGLGASYKATEYVELYANISQNYRSVNFTDFRIDNPSIDVQANIRDEEGYTADLGIRGSKEDFFKYELTLFHIDNLDKIGQIFNGNNRRFRGNISDARIFGIETFAEFSPLKLWDAQKDSPWQWSVFGNVALISARYVRSDDVSIRNKNVEMVPPINIKVGQVLRYKAASATLQYSYVGEHFSDGTNAPRTATAIEGLIPAYQVLDFSVAYRWRFLQWEGSINNLLNEQYFTRRAEGYPGPGIIPSDGRAFYTTLQVKF